MKFVMTAEIDLSSMAGKQIRSKPMEKKIHSTWFEGSKNVPLRGKITGVAPLFT